MSLFLLASLVLLAFLLCQPVACVLAVSGIPGVVSFPAVQAVACVPVVAGIPGVVSFPVACVPTDAGIPRLISFPALSASCLFPCYCW